MTATRNLNPPWPSVSGVTNSFQDRGSPHVTSWTRSRPRIFGADFAFSIRLPSSKSTVESTPFMEPETRSRRVIARVSTSSMATMECR